MRLIFPFFCLLLSSCLLKQSDTIIVRGNVKNIPATKLYLTDAYRWQIFLDSAEYKNDTFSFHINPKNFEPYLASIYFMDSEGKRRVLLYQNYILSTPSQKYGFNTFVLDKGITTISGTFMDHYTIRTEKLKITGYKQNTPFFKTQFLHFGWINTTGHEKREETINGYKHLIKQYPYSYYFIETLYNYRFQYSKRELTDMLALFNNDEEMQYFKEKFSTYFKNLPLPNVPLPNYAFQDSLNQRESTISNSSKLNMIIFWASWCGPCMLEIPELKQIYSEYKNSGIHMVSISIDENKDAWDSALRNEGMGWEQLIVDSSLLNEVENRYHFNSIPLVIFTDNKGIEIVRFSGYEQGGQDQYRRIIEKNL